VRGMETNHQRGYKGEGDWVIEELGMSVCWEER